MEDRILFMYNSPAMDVRRRMIKHAKPAWGGSFLGEDILGDTWASATVRFCFEMLLKVYREATSIR